MKPRRRQTIAGLTGAVTIRCAVRPLGDSQLSPAESRAMAKEVFLWGMHPVAIHHLRYYNVTQNEKS